MNPDDLQFEEQLRRIQPAAPSPALLQRLRATRPARRPIRFVLPLAAAAAVAIGLAASFLTRDRGTNVTHAAAPDQAVQVQPVQVSDCIVGARDAGLCRGPDGKPYRMLQVVGVGQQVWRDEASGQLVAQTYPQQHIVLVGLRTF
jgi:hypothetical protein